MTAALPPVLCAPLNFIKLSGSGNDFIGLDNRAGQLEALLAEKDRWAGFVRALCRRGLGVGADGVLLACAPNPKERGHLAVRFYEADGSYLEFCGNGAACFIYWTLAEGWLPERCSSIQTPVGLVRGGCETDGYTRICPPDATQLKLDLTLEVRGLPWTCSYICVGIPHVVSFVDDVNSLDVNLWGPALRHHPAFQPRGANANFVQVLRPGELAVRTWEFGVEGETLACGTGVVASAMLAGLRCDWESRFRDGTTPVTVRTRGGEILRVQFTQGRHGRMHHACLETRVRTVYRGELAPAFARTAWVEGAPPFPAPVSAEAPRHV